MDGITNEMLINVSKPALYKILEIFNKALQKGSLPQSWREATIVTIHKKRKSKTDLSASQVAQLGSWKES